MESNVQDHFWGSSLCISGKHLYFFAAVVTVHSVAWVLRRLFYPVYSPHGYLTSASFSFFLLVSTSLVDNSTKVGVYTTDSTTDQKTDTPVWQHKKPTCKWRLHWLKWRKRDWVAMIALSKVLPDLRRLLCLNLPDLRRLHCSKSLYCSCLSINFSIDSKESTSRQSGWLLMYSFREKLKVNQGKVVEEFPYFVFRYVAKKTPPKGPDLFNVCHSFTSYSLLHFDITLG